MIKRERVIPENSTVIENVKAKYVMYVTESKKTVKCFLGKKVKPVFYYVFPTAKELNEFVAEKVEWFEKQYKQEVKEKELKKAKNAKELENIEIGDVFRCSWGYDQSNIDYYQIIEKTAKNTFKFAQIMQETVKLHSSMSETVKPSLNNFKENGEVFTKRLKNASFKLSNFQFARKCSKNDESYTSSYA